MHCKDCKWFNGYEMTGGECRNRSPIAISIAISDKKHGFRNPVPDEIMAAWPYIKHDDWCGEFKAKETERARILRERKMTYPEMVEEAIESEND